MCTDIGTCIGICTVLSDWPWQYGSPKLSVSSRVGPRKTCIDVAVCNLGRAQGKLVLDGQRDYDESLQPVVLRTVNQIGIGGKRKMINNRDVVSLSANQDPNDSAS